MWDWRLRPEAERGSVKQAEETKSVVATANALRTKIELSLCAAAVHTVVVAGTIIY